MDQNTKKFALIGVAGYIAERHLKAIKDTDNELIAALDKSDNVGILDKYFPNASFFTEFERFDRHLDKLKRKGNKIDYISICTPNYLHDSHIRFALKHDAEAICEKPLVLNPWNIDALKVIENETGKKINTILQLRLHPDIIKLKNKIDSEPKGKVHEIDLTYITSRGKWYYYSWKGDIQKSGGIVTNIGIHFFDMLTWIFGDVEENIVYCNEQNKAAGVLKLQHAKIKWILSIDYNDLPNKIKQKKHRTYRSIILDEKEIEFSDGFTDLHTLSYKKILEGKGFGMEDARLSINTVYEIRNAIPDNLKKEKHSVI